MLEIRKKTAIVICVYNNKGTLRQVAEAALKQQCALVTVVDDGCTDCDVQELLQGLDITLLRHEKNYGKGKALKTALDFLADKS